ncbi:MAG: hypothetical protein IJA85_03795 [Clostridia bacterium]|nr:hypothetical protein [Clostridia bacterium]MBQ4574298.1 hypothetical protein [Clostridia bacterium]
MTLFLRICGCISLLGALIALLGIPSEGVMAVMALLSLLASGALFFCVADLLTRVGYLENMLHVRYSEKLNDPELPKKKCIRCGQEIDFDYVICPHCGKKADERADQ